MDKSNSIASLAAALVKAQANIGGAVKGTANPFFKSRFADLGSVIEACKSALLDEGITVSQLPCVLSSGAPGLETVLVHSSGEWMSGIIPVICTKQNDPQALGSSYTYARRYALQSTLLIPAVDDDAEAAMFRQDDSSRIDQGSRDHKPTMPWRDVRIHFGKHLGKPLGSLEAGSVKWFASDWLEKKRVNGAISEQDDELMAALELWKQENN